MENITPNKLFNTYNEGLDLEVLRAYCMGHVERRVMERGETLEEAGETAQWVAYVERGCFKYMVHIDEEGKAQFIDIPLLASIRLPLGTSLKLAFNVGPYLALCAGGKVKDNLSPSLYDESFSSVYTGFDYGLQAGVELIISYHLGLGIDYQIGMQSKYANRNLMVGIGYRF